MNELKDMTKDELLDELESKNIHVVSNETLSNYSDAMDDIMQAFMEIVDDVDDNYFNEPTQKQLETLWQEENQSWAEVGGEVEPFDEEFAKALYYRKNVGQAIEDDAGKFLSWLDNNNRFFTYVSLEDDSEFVDLIEYHPCTNLESYLLEDKQALEQVLCQQ